MNYIEVIKNNILQETGEVEISTVKKNNMNYYKGENNGVKSYNKLVRDRIPEIIKASGRNCNIAIAKDEYKFELLEEKLKEEVNEFLEDKNLEELADIIEVVYGLAEHMGYSEEELNKKRLEKLEERGGFKKGIVLVSTM